VKLGVEPRVLDNEPNELPNYSISPYKALLIKKLDTGLEPISLDYKSKILPIKLI
jgi:hypothetical protein